MSILKHKPLFLLTVTLSCSLLFSCANPNHKNTRTTPTKCLSKKAGIDIGSGSTKFLLALVDVCQQKIKKIIFEESESIKFKESLKEDKKISLRLRTKSLLRINKFKSFIDKKHPKASIHAVATEVFRQASNGPESIQWLSKNTGIDIQIIDQEKEALLAFWGAYALSPNAHTNLIVWDIGGGSMQMILAEDLKKNKFNTYKGKLASVSFKNKVLEMPLMKNKKHSPNPLGLKLSNEAFDQAFAYAQKDLPKRFKNLKAKKVIGVGGVHSKSVARQVHLKEGQTYSPQQIIDTITSKAYLNDQEIGGLYPETDVTNLILVLAYMKALGLKSVKPLPVNLTHGLVVLSQN